MLFLLLLILEEIGLLLALMFLALAAPFLWLLGLMLFDDPCGEPWRESATLLCGQEPCSLPSWSDYPR